MPKDCVNDGAHPASAAPGRAAWGLVIDYEIRPAMCRPPCRDRRGGGSGWVRILPFTRSLRGRIRPGFMTDLVKHKRMANAIRALAMDAVERAKSGHPGMPMGMADVATVLFTRYLKFDPTEPRWPDRDRFVLSAGHGSMLLYSVLYLLGVEEMTHRRDPKNFRQLGLEDARPSRRTSTPPGVETTTGPLGQGARQCRRHGACRAHDGGRVRRRRRRPPHLCDRLRRRPDGGRSATRRSRSPAISVSAS